MNRSLVWTCLGALVAIVGLRGVADVLETASQPSAAATGAALPFVDNVQMAMQHLVHQAMVAGTWLGVFALVLLMFFFLMGESGHMSFERLPAPAVPDDLEALRSVLRTVRAWLKQQQLPATVSSLVQSISEHCDDLDRLLDKRVYADVATTVHALPKLLGSELSELVRRYRKIPNAQKRNPFLNRSANELLQTGLCGVDEQLRAVQEQLTNDDVRELATQSRYLELVGQHAGASDSSPATAAKDQEDRTAPPALRSRSFRLSRTARAGWSATSSPRAQDVETRDTRNQVSHMSARPHRLDELGRAIRSLTAPAPNDVGGGLLSDVLPLVSLGVAAGAAASIVSECIDSDKRTDESLSERGGGRFGGAGASGAWCEDRAQEEVSCTELPYAGAGDEPDDDNGYEGAAAPNNDDVTNVGDTDTTDDSDASF